MSPQNRSHWNLCCFFSLDEEGCAEHDDQYGKQTTNVVFTVRKSDELIL